MRNITEKKRFGSVKLGRDSARLRLHTLAHLQGWRQSGLTSGLQILDNSRQTS